MYSLRQLSRARGKAGEPLPTVFPGLEFRRGQLVVAAAAPGVGKSVFALTLCLRAKVPAFIFSADSDAHTQMTRAMCILAGTDLWTAGRAVLEGKLDALGGSQLRFSQEASPTIDDIERELLAYEEVFGETPALVVIDNITDVVIGRADGEEYSEGLEGLLSHLHKLARTSGSCFLGLHHVTGQYNDGDKPIPLSGVKGQLGRVPEMVLTMFKKSFQGQGDTLCVSTVKNRTGKADASGDTYAEFEFDGDRASITTGYTT